MYTGKTYGWHGKAGHDAHHELLAKGKPEEASLLPYFQNTLQYKTYGRQGKAGRDAFHALLAEGKQEEASLLPYFQDTLQWETYGWHSKAGRDAYRALLAEGKQQEVSLMTYFQDTLQWETYGRHSKAGYDKFKELVEENKLSLARDTPYYQDTWQYEAYGSGGYARYKETTAKVREHASEILTVQRNGDYSYVRTVWTCTASCCASKVRWYGIKDKFSMQHKTHAGGNASFIETVNRSKNRSKLGYCSLCTSAPMTLMRLGNMPLKRHLAYAGIHIWCVVKKGGVGRLPRGCVCACLLGRG